MRSAKERLHDVLRKGHSRSSGPDYTRALKVLAEAINERSDRLVDLEDEVEALKEREGDLQDSMRQHAKRIEVAESRSREARRAAKMAGEDNTKIRDRDEVLADRIDGLQNNINDLRDAVEEAKAGANKALDRLVAHAKTHQQLRQEIKDVDRELGRRATNRMVEALEQKIDDTDAVLGDVLTELELEEKQSSPLGLGTGDSWGGWHEDEHLARDTGDRAGEDLPHAPHEDLADDVRDVFPNATIAVRESDEQPGLDVEVDGVSYYVHPGRSVDEKTDGWKLKRTHRAWLVQRALRTIK